MGKHNSLVVRDAVKLLAQLAVQEDAQATL